MLATSDANRAIHSVHVPIVPLPHTADPVLPCCRMGTLQRAVWDGHPVWLGLGFELRKPKGERELRAVCSLQTDQLGWKLWLEVKRPALALAGVSFTRWSARCLGTMCAAMVTMVG